MRGTKRILATLADMVLMAVLLPLAILYDVLHLFDVVLDRAVDALIDIRVRLKSLKDKG